MVFILLRRLRLEWNGKKRRNEWNMSKTTYLESEWSGINRESTVFQICMENFRTTAQIICIWRSTYATQFLFFCLRWDCECVCVLSVIYVANTHWIKNINRNKNAIYWFFIKVIIRKTFSEMRQFNRQIWKYITILNT